VVLLWLLSFPAAQKIVHNSDPFFVGRLPPGVTLPQSQPSPSEKPAEETKGAEPREQGFKGAIRQARFFAQELSSLAVAAQFKTGTDLSALLASMRSECPLVALAVIARAPLCPIPFSLLSRAVSSDKEFKATAATWSYSGSEQKSDAAPVVAVKELRKATGDEKCVGIRSTRRSR
jgi:hypothetical protein